MFSKRIEGLVSWAVLFSLSSVFFKDRRRTVHTHCAATVAVVERSSQMCSARSYEQQSSNVQIIRFDIADNGMDIGQSTAPLSSFKFTWETGLVAFLPTAEIPRLYNRRGHARVKGAASGAAGRLQSSWVRSPS